MPQILLQYAASKRDTHFRLNPDTVGSKITPGTTIYSTNDHQKCAREQTYRYHTGAMLPSLT